MTDKTATLRKHAVSCESCNRMAKERDEARDSLSKMAIVEAFVELLAAGNEWERHYEYPRLNKALAAVRAQIGGKNGH